MSRQNPVATPVLKVEQLTKINQADLNDLCDATEAAIKVGGGFGWIKVPEREVLERYWEGVITIPARLLFVSRIDGVICGTAQVILPALNNESQSFAVKMTGVFTAPWARGYGLSRMLIEKVEGDMLNRSIRVINLDVRETMTAAVNLFESMGYYRIGTHPHYSCIDGEIQKGYYYTKLLEGGSVELSAADEDALI